MPIIRTDRLKIDVIVPQAALTVGSYCNQQKCAHYFAINYPDLTYVHASLPMLRGCITSGEEWSFFIFKGPKDALKAEFHYSYQFNLREGLNLSRFLGLLCDWVRAESGSYTPFGIE
jgi:hypothetical protein